MKKKLNRFELVLLADIDNSIFIPEEDYKYGIYYAYSLLYMYPKKRSLKKVMKFLREKGNKKEEWVYKVYHIKRGDELEATGEYLPARDPEYVISYTFDAGLTVLQD